MFMYGARPYMLRCSLQHTQYRCSQGTVGEPDPHVYGEKLLTLSDVKAFIEAFYQSLLHATQGVLNIVHLIDSAQYTILCCGCTLVLSRLSVSCVLWMHL